MNLIDKIKEKSNFPLILFLIILINYLPLFINNAFTKDAKAVSSFVMVICFGIEIIGLIFFYFYNKKNIIIDKRKIIVLFSVVVIMTIVQINNFFQKKFFIMDVFNIGCTLVNIFLLYIVIYDFKIDEEKISLFFKGIFWIGIVAVFWNFVLFNQEILSNLNIIEITSNKYMRGIKGFFANRNSLAFFLNIAIMSNAFITVFEKEKKRYKVSLAVHLFGIWCTYSKTGYALAIVFLELFFLLNDSYSMKKRLAICFIIGIIGIIGILDITGIEFINVNGEVAEKITTTVDVKRLSGRTDIWKRGFNILNESPINYLFGVGRFNSTNALTFKNQKFTQFHNVYLDILLTGGLMELFYIGFIYFSVIKKIIKSNMNKNLKKIYIIMFLVYASYIMMESCGRFSIGAVDTLCMIFFITIPILHANSCTQYKKLDGGKKE